MLQEAAGRDAAIAAARRGWCVFPCRRDGDLDRDGKPAAKHPAVRRWQEWATNDPDAVARGWPSARHNVGLALEPSGLVALDLDSGATHGGAAGEHGRLVLAALAAAAGQPWPVTYTVATPGGEHLYFAAIPGRRIRNSSERVGPLIDVRGAGGQVLAAGSVVGSRAYVVADDREPAPLPPWLADLADPPRREPPAGAPPAPMVSTGSRYAAAALRAELETLRASRQPGRNDQLNKSAFALFTLVAAGVLDDDMVTGQLRQAAESTGLAADDGMHSVLATIASARTAGLASPRRRGS